MSAAVLREVRLYGALGQQFGRLFKLAVATPAEAVAALRAVLPGFERAFVGRDGRAAYHVFVGRREQRRDIGEKDLNAPLGASEPIRLVPVIAGAKRGGVLQTVIGVVLLVAAFVGYGNQYTVQLGISLILGGVIQMLSPQRVGRDDRDASAPSYAFDGPVNNVEQGGPVPLIFGRVVCGSTVVSQGLSSGLLIVTTGPPLTPVALPPYEQPAPESGGP